MASIPIPLRPAACFSPHRCFALVQNQRPRETQPQCSVKLPFTEKVNGRVNRSVNRVFHAPFTFPRQERPPNLSPALAWKRLHQAYGRYQRELPPYTQRPSSQENLTENLCDLPFFFRAPVPPAVPWRQTHVRR